jgi:hypothetical protein
MSVKNIRSHDTHELLGKCWTVCQHLRTCINNAHAYCSVYTYPMHQSSSIKNSISSMHFRCIRTVGNRHLICIRMHMQFFHVSHVCWKLNAHVDASNARRACEEARHVRDYIYTSINHMHTYICLLSHTHTYARAGSHTSSHTHRGARTHTHTHSRIVTDRGTHTYRDICRQQDTPQ